MAREGAGRHIYTSEMNAAVDEATACLIELISTDASPVVDVASGRGALTEPMVTRGLDSELITAIAVWMICAHNGDDCQV